MALLVWNNGGVGSLWSTDGNWVGGVAPIATDTVQFDVTSVANSSCDISVAGVDIQATYSGTGTVVAAVSLGDLSIAAGAFDFGSLAVTIKDYTRSGGTVTGSSDVLNITGNTLITGGTFVHNSGQVGFTKTTGSQDFDSSVVDVFFQLRLAKTVWDFLILDQKIQGSNRIIIDNNGNTSSPQLRGTIELIGTAKLEQNGNLNSGFTGLILFSGANEWIQNNTDTSAQIPSIEVSGTDLTLTEGTAGNSFGFEEIRWTSGTITNSETSHFKSNQQFSHYDWTLFQPLTIGQLTRNLSNFDLRIRDLAETGGETLIVNGATALLGVAGGSGIVLGTLEMKGNYTQQGSAASISSGDIKLTGTTDQTIVMTGGLLEIIGLDVEVNKASGDLILTTDIIQAKTGYTFTQTQGRIVTNGFNISAKAGLTINDDFADLAGSTLATEGTFSATNATMEGTSTWFLDVNGTNVADNCSIKNCDASAFNPWSALSSTDAAPGGTNTAVLFIAAEKFWIGAGAGSASDNTRWSLSSGGANDTTAAGINDAVTFDGNGLGNCDWDTPQVASIDVVTAYTGVQTQSVDLICPLFVINSGVGQEWITNGNVLRVDFKFTQIANKGVTHTAGGTIFWGGNVEQTGGTTNTKTSPVVIDGGLSTPTVAKTHNFNANSNSSRAEFITLGQNQHMFVDTIVTFGQITCEANTRVTADTASSLFQIHDAIINPENCDFSGDSVNQLTINFLTATPAPSDYNNCQILFQTSAPIADTWTTTGRVEFGSVSGTRTYTMTGSLTCADCFVGVSNPATGAILDQLSGSSLQVSGDMTVRQDNTIVENKWIRAAGVLNTLIEGAFTVEPDAALDWSGDTSTVTVVGAFGIDSTSICNFGITTCVIGGDYTNATNANSCFNVIFATSPSAITLQTILRLTGTLAFTGEGDFDVNSQTCRIDSFGTQLDGVENVNFLNTGLGGTLTLDITGGDTVTIPGRVYLGWNLTFIRTGTEADFSILGDTQFDIATFGGLIKAHIGGFTLTCPNRVENAGSSNTSTILLEGGVIDCLNYEHQGALAVLTGPGTLTVTADLRHTVGTLDLDGIVATTANYVPSVGVTLNNNTGSLTLSGDYNVLDNVFTSDLVGGTVGFNGGATQDYNLGGGVGPGNLVIEKSAGLVAINDDQGSNTKLSLSASSGNATIQFIGGNTYNFDTISSSGVAGNKTSMASDVGGVQYILNFNSAASLLRYVGIKDSDFANIIQRVDTLTGSDDGNNVLAGANGLLFVALAISNNVMTFQATRLDVLKDAFDTWMLTNSDNHIFTSAQLQVQADVRTVNRLFTINLFYNGDGVVLTNPFVLNYSDGSSLDAVNASFEDSVVANPVSSEFYGSMFVHRTDITRKSTLFNYIWITNSDEVAAPTNWSAANDIT